MTQFTIASFNVKNLIEADQEYYKYESYTPEEHSWKQAWLADQVLTMNADIVCFQEIFSEKSLRDVIEEADAEGAEANAANIPGRSTPNVTRARRSFANWRMKAIAMRALPLRPTPMTADQVSGVQVSRSCRALALSVHRKCCKTCPNRFIFRSAISTDRTGGTTRSGGFRGPC